MEYSDLFLITSVINTGDKAWSYCATRSFYTPQERFEQTLQTIESIRNLNDSSRIMLVECSDLSESMTVALKSKVDYFLQCIDDADVRASCLNSEKKGYGEAKKSQRAVEYILTHNVQFNRLFKISGRYFLNDQFIKSRFSETVYTFRRKVDGTNSTVLYSVPYALLNHYLAQLKRCSDVYARQVIGYEIVLPSGCTPMCEIEIVGVSGKVAVSTNEFFSA
jgi:hypothetical protein